MAKKYGKGKFYEVNGQWIIDTHIIVRGKNIHLHQRGFSSKREAKEAFESLVDKARNEHAYDGNSVTYESFLNEFKEYRAKSVCPSTIRTTDGYAIPKYLNPYFDGKTVTKAFEIENVTICYQDLMRDTRVSTDRKNKVVRLLKDMLSLAYNRFYIDPRTYQEDALTCFVLKDTHTPTERVVWDEGEKQSFLLACGRGSIDYVMFSLFLATAPRIGEFLGLMANCYNPEGKYIEIKQQVMYEGHGSYQLTNRLKSHNSYRKIYLTDDVCTTLEKYITDFDLKPNDYLFSAFGNRHDKPLSRTEFTRKMDHYIKLAGVRKCNPHAIRHMKSVEFSKQCATMADLEAVASQLGHTPTVELNIYAKHNTEDRVRALLGKMERVEGKA
jgi:integrase